MAHARNLFSGRQRRISGFFRRLFEDKIHRMTLVKLRPAKRCHRAGRPLEQASRLCSQLVRRFGTGLNRVLRTECRAKKGTQRSDGALGTALPYLGSRSLRLVVCETRVILRAWKQHRTTLRVLHGRSNPGFPDTSGRFRGFHVQTYKRGSSPVRHAFLTHQWRSAGRDQAGL